jgi:hypothetical protein
MIFFGARLRTGARPSWSSVLGEMRLCDKSSCVDIHSPVLGPILVFFAPLPNHMPLAQ